MTESSPWPTTRDAERLLFRSNIVAGLDEAATGDGASWAAEDGYQLTDAGLRVGAAAASRS